MNFDQLVVELGPFWILPENGAYPNNDLGGVLCVFLHSHTKANYSEEYLLTFLFIKYFGIRPLKIIHIFRFNLTLEITSVWPFPNLKCQQIESLKDSMKRHIICDYDV